LISKKVSEKKEFSKNITYEHQFLSWSIESTISKIFVVSTLIEALKKTHMSQSEPDKENIKIKVPSEEDYKKISTLEIPEVISTKTSMEFEEKFINDVVILNTELNNQTISLPKKSDPQQPSP
jgi:mRNA deadenylase 3'-5' endonuclease subunit Ccr4